MSTDGTQIRSSGNGLHNNTIKKVNSADVPMPYSSVLEKKYLPQVEDIILAIKEVCYI